MDVSSSTGSGPGTAAPAGRGGGRAEAADGGGLADAVCDVGGWVGVAAGEAAGAAGDCGGLTGAGVVAARGRAQNLHREDAGGIVGPGERMGRADAAVDHGDRPLADEALCGPPITEVHLSEQDSVTLASVFAALADPVRLRLLAKAGSARQYLAVTLR